VTELAYVDSSCLVAVAFDEPGSADLRARLAAASDLLSSNLLEAELRATFVREEASGPEPFLIPITWVLPDRPLGPEIVRVLEAGYARGADVWHLATALYLADDPADLPFLTLDVRQRELARVLGFPTAV